MSDQAMRALRTAAAWTTSGHLSCVRISGPDAYDAVDGVCTAELFLRDTQMRAALLLDDDARIAADVFVCRDDDDFILLCDGMTAAALIALVRDGSAPGLRYDAADMTEGHRILSVNGPWAWEVLARIIGPEVIGLPYMSLLRLQPGICFRAGKTGEYGYDLLLENADARDLLDRLHELAAEYDMSPAGLDALDQCALENCFFSIRRDARGDVTPLELQLQWRVSYRKQYRGRDALMRRRSAGIVRRTTTLVAPRPVAADDRVFIGDREIGVILNAGYSPARGDHVALALLDLPYASPGITAYHVVHGGACVEAGTVSPPVINNRSLHVSPQLHTYGTRAEFTFPDLRATHAARR